MEPPPFTLVHAKDHPVLERATDWLVAEVSLLFRGRPTCSSGVTLSLARGRQTRRIAFESVADFTMTAAFAADPTPLRILDVTHLQWSGVTVRVESTCGGLAFWAAKVSRDRPATRRGASGERPAAVRRVGSRDRQRHG